MDKPKSFEPRGDVHEPFLKGRDPVLDPYENLAVQRDAWKKTSMRQWWLILLLVVGIVYISMRSEYIPFMVRINEQTGFTEAVGPIKEVKYNPHEAEITYFLGEFVKNIRSIPLDPVVYNANWTKAANFLSSRAGQKLNAMIAGEEQTSFIGKATILPRILAIQPMANSGGATYVVRWEEEIFFVGSAASKTINSYSGTVTFSIQPPSKKEQYYKNPIGLIIEDLSYTKENTSVIPLTNSRKTQPAATPATTQQQPPLSQGDNKKQ